MRGLPLEDVRAVNAVAVGGVQANVTLLLDVPYETIHARIGERQDRFEGEGSVLLRRVIAGYRRLAEEDAAVHLIDGRGTVDEVQQMLRRELLQL